MCSAILLEGYKYVSSDRMDCPCRDERPLYAYAWTLYIIYTQHQMRHYTPRGLKAHDRCFCYNLRFSVTDVVRQLLCRDDIDEIASFR